MEFALFNEGSVGRVLAGFACSCAGEVVGAVVVAELVAGCTGIDNVAAVG